MFLLIYPRSGTIAFLDGFGIDFTVPEPKIEFFWMQTSNFATIKNFSRRFQIDSSIFWNPYKRKNYLPWLAYPDPKTYPHDLIKTEKWRSSFRKFVTKTSSRQFPIHRKRGTASQYERLCITMQIHSFETKLDLKARQWK